MGRMKGKLGGPGPRSVGGGVREWGAGPQMQLVVRCVCQKLESGSRMVWRQASGIPAVHFFNTHRGTEGEGGALWDGREVWVGVGWDC